MIAARTLRALVGALLALAAPAAALAQSNVITVQRNAGTPDAEGWTRATSKDGKFSVDMPCRFTEMRIKDDKADDGRTHFASSGTVVMCIGRPLSALVLRSTYNSKGDGADHYFTTMLAEDEAEGTVERLEYQGLRAFRSFSQLNGMCNWNLSIRIGEELLSVVAYGQAEDCETLRPSAERVFTSFVLKQ